MFIPIISEACPRALPQRLYQPQPHQSPLEKPHGVRVEADKHILRLLIMIQHRLMILPANARLLVSAERRARRIQVIAVRPHAPGLQSMAELARAIQITRPDARAQELSRE